MSDERIYLDNAATSWPKPEPVYQAVTDCMRRLGAPTGRSTYREAHEVGKLVDQARRSVAELINAQRPQQVVFTYSGTDSLNLALHGLLQPGDHVITSTVEHNSVLRPLEQLQRHGSIEVTHVPCDRCGRVDPDDIRREIRSATRLIAVVHASNVTGAIQPIPAISQIAKQHGALLLVDAAQSLGYLPVDVQQLGIDLLAAPGHKGLLGPLGTGVLYVADGIDTQINSTRQGGTGTQSDQPRQPDTMPDKFESGNLNAPGIAGLGAGVRYLLDRGADSLRQHHVEICQPLVQWFQDNPSITVYGPQASSERVGVISLNVDGYDPRELATLLDASFSIQIRSGFHCAPLLHQQLQTASRSGTARLSPGIFTTRQQVQRVVEAFEALVAMALR